MNCRFVRLNTTNPYCCLTQRQLVKLFLGVFTRNCPNCLHIRKHIFLYGAQLSHDDAVSMQLHSHNKCRSFSNIFVAQYEKKIEWVKCCFLYPRVYHNPSFSNKCIAFMRCFKSFYAYLSVYFIYEFYDPNIVKRSCLSVFVSMALHQI